MLINDTLKKEVDDKKYIVDKTNVDIVYQSFWDEIIKKICWNSNAIEGNTLTLEETIELIDYDKTRNNHKYSEYYDAKCLYNALEKQLSPNGKNIDLDYIIETNGYIQGIKNNTLRNKPVYVGNMLEVVYYPPEHTEVPKLLNNLLKMKIDNINDITLFHLKFERIHPFNDGNGRTGRLILNQQLINLGYEPMYFSDNSKYHQSFKIYDRNQDSSYLEHIILKSELNSLNNIIDKIKLYEQQRENFEKNDKLK